MATIDELRSVNLEELLSEGWKTRNDNFPSILTVSAPGAKTYISDHHRNKRNSFVNISVTGKACALNCEHCQKNLLQSMIPVTSGDELKALGESLVAKKCQGVLVSGGATATGEVPLDNYFDAIHHLKELGLKVLVHTGLATRETARRLKQAGADQALLDVIGARETIERVYHLDREPWDFFASMEALTEAGLDVIPHIIVGLDFGRIVGEYEALEMVTRIKPNTIVIVVLSPLLDTPMENVVPANAEDVGRITAIARIVNPNAYLTMGCARPPGTSKELMERYAVRAGITGIAYPIDPTIEYAKGQGLEVIFKDTCCSLL